MADGVETSYRPDDPSHPVDIAVELAEINSENRERTVSDTSGGNWNLSDFQSASYEVVTTVSECHHQSIHL